MLPFSAKKTFLNLVLTICLSSTLQADRMKSLDNYFHDVEQSAKEVGSQFKNLKNVMDEIYNPDPFVKKTFLGVKPRWYTAGHGYYTFTTVYPYQIKNTIFKKKIRGILFEDQQAIHPHSKQTIFIELYMYSLKFLIKNTFSYDNYQKKLKASLEDRVFPSSNINQIIFELEKYDDKIRALVEHNIYMNVKKLSKNIHHSDNDFMKKHRNQTQPFNMYDNDDKIIRNNQNKFKLKSLVYLFNNDLIEKSRKYGKELVHANNYKEALEQIISKLDGGRLKVQITINNHEFKIIHHSRNELYNKENDLFSLLDEYESKGFCTKVFPKRKSSTVTYKSLEGQGYIQYTRTPVNKKYIRAEGYWVTSMWNRKDDIEEIRKSIKEKYESFVKLANEYHTLALEKLIEKYTNNSRKEFGNEF